MHTMHDLGFNVLGIYGFGNHSGVRCSAGLIRSARVRVGRGLRFRAKARNDSSSGFPVGLIKR